MLDLKWLRDNPDALDRALARRRMAPVAERLLELDSRHRALHTRLQERQTRRKALSREIGQLRGRGEAADELVAEVNAIKDELQAGEEEQRRLQAELEAELAYVPNPPAEEVPDGDDERDNPVLRSWGEPRRFDFEPRGHDEVGARLGMDFEAAAKLSGARFVVLRDKLALLERALARFMLDLQTKEHGYVEVHVPYLVREQALFATGQLPKFADDQFRTTTDHWLIPTAEVPLTNLVAGDILSEDDLPVRVTAYTPCFRAEAGAAGRDTKGMIRQHQFTKVELVSVTRPEDSVAEHERMTACAEEVLRRLELPYRVVELCTGDIGFAARRTYDIEVWLPGQGMYREISSCSNCGDFQARRMQARYRPKGQRGTLPVHTLNGSGLAVGRALIAVLENGQEPDGSVTIPQALRPYMDGLERLEPES